MTMSCSTTIRNAMMDGITTAAGTLAKLRLYSGTRPGTGGGALSGNTLLAELICNATFAPAASGGVLTLNAVTTNTAAATGTATWARLVKTDGTTWVMDLDVAVSGSDVNINSTSIVSGANVSVTSAAFTAGNP